MPRDALGIYTNCGDAPFSKATQICIPYIIYKSKAFVEYLICVYITSNNWRPINLIAKQLLLHIVNKFNYIDHKSYLIENEC